MSQSAVTHFTEAEVLRLSEALKEPRWLTEHRLAALHKFRELPLETSPLYTKYAGLSAFDPEQFSTRSGEERLDLRTHFHGFLTGNETNIVLQGNSTAVHVDLDEKFAQSGVEVLDLGQALAKHEGLLRDLLSRELVGASSDKYAALNAAFFTSLTFVRVPRGVTAPSSLRRMLVVKDPPGSTIERTILYAEEGSTLNYLEELYTGSNATGGGSPYLLGTCLEVFADKNAKVETSTLQLLDERAVFLANDGVSAASDARVTVAALHLGGKITRSRLRLCMDGRGSSVEGLEVFFGGGQQRFDLESNLQHNAPNTAGSMNARAVLNGEAQSIFKGMIKINANAKSSTSYLAYHAMILDRRARADDIPGLDIDNNEVKATHSASVSQMDEEQVFYLMARGLPPDEAKKMIVIGFFEPVLVRIPVEMARESARFIVEGKWHGERRRLVDRETLLSITGEAPTEVRQDGDIFERHYKYRG